MKIIIDNAIPFIRGVFEPYCTVEYIDGKSFTPQIIEGAEALIIRTRTHCDSTLLEGSSVSHIATATIGFDHIDLEYCRSHNIEVSTAAGCNARAVLQWVGAALVHLSKQEGWEPHQRTLGVVGVGNVGSLVAKYAAMWGFDVVCCDPPRQQREAVEFVSLDELVEKADIITLHTPLDKTTHHMIDAKLLDRVKHTATIINCSRGEVVATEAILRSGHKFMMDVWEDEPRINPKAVAQAIISTTHIAGYSLQGKANATTMAVRSVAQSLGLPLTSWSSDAPRVEPQDIGWNELCTTIGKEFNIEGESDCLKSNIEQFESIRNSYNYRNEYF